MFFLNLYRLALFVLLKSIQSQFKTIQPQLNVKGTRINKNTGEPERLFFIANVHFNLKLQMQEPARGHPLWTFFLQVFLKGFKKKAIVLKKVNKLNL